VIDHKIDRAKRYGEHEQVSTYASDEKDIRTRTGNSDEVITQAWIWSHIPHPAQYGISGIHAFTISY
jgi:hypothetical protein